MSHSALVFMPRRPVRRSFFPVAAFLSVALAVSACGTPPKPVSDHSKGKPYVGRWDIDPEATIRRQMALKKTDWNRLSADRQKEAVENYPLQVQILLRGDGTWEGFFRTGAQKGTLGTGKYRAADTGSERWDFLFMEENTPDRTIGGEMDGEFLVLRFNPADPAGIVMRKRAVSQ